ncbi:hypothetical protein H2198_007423 [Neophaeococcomyces mojaviensis]|uniref:Uncharacterized protein n=1 Tax=Neophaeococcomyces mojaviensis TaxID=3383035 RepID=A0ACC3A028_9EURO|nr:hypothetical protein H2198_007423 [Knufia sp. JES_112]
MDYFDFDEATVPPFDLDADNSSLAGEYNQNDANECFDSLFFDKSVSLPVDKQSHLETVKLKLINDCEVEAVRWNDDSTVDYPMFKAKSPCSLCAQMGMDCYLAARGMLIMGCTACISLYRPCSFTHPEMPQGYVNTFPGIAEDEQICHGPITTQRKELNSMTDPRSRKSGARFHRDAVKILKQWLSEHTDHPYPNERERDDLKQLTGLKRSQINNWLANARRRGKVRPTSGPASPILGAVDIPIQSTLHTKDGYESLGPLDRWKCSPPEHEPASMTAIARAVTNKDAILPHPSRNQSVSSLHNSRPSSRRASTEDDSSSLSLMLNRAPSISSFETRQSSNSDFSFASSHSHKSKQSFASSMDRRRRRRAPLSHQRTNSLAKANGNATNTQPTGKNRRSPTNRIFQCTFCTDTFASKYDWQRHEKSLHLALERWTCCPMGPTRIDPVTGQEQCVFCPTLLPTAAHFETHQFLTCHEKTLAERTFYRKDHLRQHLRLIHGVKFDPHMDTWKSTTFEIKSRCGFCPSMFATWQSRADHLAAHFRNGADMKDWGGGWGFESHVERLVENAIPPYLVGLERNTMNPYRAREAPKPSPNQDSTSPNMTTPSGGNSGGQSCDNRSDDDERVEVDQRTKDSNCWNRLEEELIKYVLEQKSLGNTITDKSLQDYARMVIYGDPDPWDWTMADNQIWLDAFKHEHELYSPKTSELSPDYKDTRSVPVMAPYVVKGGLKSKKVPSHSGPCDASVGHRLPSFSMPGIQERDCSLQSSAGSFQGGTPITPDQRSLFNFCPVTQGELELPMQAMDIDFGAIDFNNLDLNAFGEMDFSEDAGQALPVTTMMDVGPQYAPVTLAGAMDLSGLPIGKPLLMQRNVLDDAPEMSLEAFDQLTGYMEGFK